MSEHGHQGTYLNTLLETLSSPPLDMGEFKALGLVKDEDGHWSMTPRELLKKTNTKLDDTKTYKIKDWYLEDSAGVRLKIQTGPSSSFIQMLGFVQSEGR